MSLLINSIANRLSAIEYGLTKPQSLIVLVPIIAQLVQYLQVNRIPPPTSSDQVFAYAAKIDPINKYHSVGATVRAIGWVALLIFTGNLLFAFCSIPALYQAYSSSQKFIHGYSFEVSTGREFGFH